MYKQKFDNLFFGIFTSLLVTLFGMLLIYILRYMPLNISLEKFIEDLSAGTTKTSSSLSLCLLANIPLMYFNQTRKRFKAFYGISTVILTMAVIIICSKFNWFH